MTDPNPPKVAIVTGAASGIGAAATLELAAAGFVPVGIDLAECPAALEGIDGLAWLRGDVCDTAVWDRAVGLCGELDPAGPSALVACAADVSVRPFLATSPEEWLRLFQINVVGVVIGMQAVIPSMARRGSGAIAVTCSINSLFVEDGVSAYSASKAALLSATRSAALDHARDGLWINAVCPGCVETPLLHKHLDSLADPEAALAAIKRRVPSGKLTQPGEVASVLRFLVSEEAAAISGAALVVDGGVTSTYDFQGSP